MSASGWIAVDLDGTLAHYDHWRGVDHVGEPIAPMVERVKAWIAEGVEVKIFTARVCSTGDDRDTAEVRRHIEEWCLLHIGSVLPVTNVKDFGMIELWDDRAIRVRMNTGEPCCDALRA